MHRRARMRIRIRRRIVGHSRLRLLGRLWLPVGVGRVGAGRDKDMGMGRLRLRR